MMVMRTVVPRAAAVRFASTIARPVAPAPRTWLAFAASTAVASAVGYTVVSADSAPAVDYNAVRKVRLQGGCGCGLLR